MDDIIEKLIRFKYLPDFIIKNNQIGQVANKL
jgi:hypothetical protein